MREIAANRIMLVAGVVLTFVPPFVWGPLILFAYFTQKKHNALVVTNRGIIHIFRNPLKGTYRITEIPRDDVVGLSMRFGIIDRFIGGSGDLFIRYNDQGSTRIITFDHLRKGHAFKKRLEQELKQEVKVA